jgi:hypothetical protein
MLNSEPRLVLLKRHLVERTILGDAGIVDEHIDRAEVGLDLLDAGSAGIERTHVPFIDGNAGLGLEFFRRRVIARIAGGDVISGGFQRLADGRTDAPRSPRDQRNTCHVVFLLGGLFYKPELSRSFVFRMKMPGARPGISFLSA